MRSVLILGSGFGGISTALTLRELLPAQDKIILVDRRTHFMVGFRKTWAMLDIAPLAEGMRPLSALSKRSIVVRRANVDKIEPDSCSAILDGERVSADALVVALGVRHAPEKIPGYNQHALNAYALHDLEQVKQALYAFDGSKIVMGVFGTPYQCPPAPYEIAILTKEFFDKRNIDVDITVISPKPMTLWAAGEDSSNRLEQRMAEFGIDFLPNHKVLSVEAGAVVTDQGRLSCDLAFGVPPHVAADVVRHSPLAAADGWVHADRLTLETEFENVYAIGDCTKIPIGKKGQLPKAGLFAEKEGEVVAKRIAARLGGQEPTAVLDGHALCYVETGRGEAAVIGGDFLADPKPDINLSEMSREHFANKHEFESSRLEKWFG
jgi:sulfide:quinone oxidoreductase